ncbi:MAG TPA: hypothetical protein VMO26_27695 [Vicinamibacterales bacterium]|nr:hypothetical protein [Vicinamibacterales bacterium]
MRDVVQLQHHRAPAEQPVPRELVAASERERQAPFDRAERAALVRLFSSYSFVSGGVTNTITFRLDNATNKLYRIT